MEIGSKIKQLRYKCGLTQEQLASRLGISAQSVSKWENAVAMPDITLLPMLAEVFGVSIDELFDLTVKGFYVFAWSFLFAGFAIFFSGFFTALNDGLTSAIISFMRTLVFQIAAVMLLPLVWGIDGIWWSIVVAEAMAVVFGGIFLIAKQKKYQY